MGQIVPEGSEDQRMRTHVLLRRPSMESGVQLGREPDRIVLHFHLWCDLSGCRVHPYLVYHGCQPLSTPRTMLRPGNPARCRKAPEYQTHAPEGRVAPGSCGANPPRCTGLGGSGRERPGAIFEPETKEARVLGRAGRHRYPTCETPPECPCLALGKHTREAPAHMRLVAAGTPAVIALEYRCARRDIQAPLARQQCRP